MPQAAVETRRVDLVLSLGHIAFLRTLAMPAIPTPTQGASRRLGA